MYLKWNDNPKYREDVKIAQAFLNIAYNNVDSDIRTSLDWPWLKEDGYFGLLTSKAVAAFQKVTKLIPPEYGILGDDTMRKLKNFGPSISAVHIISNDCLLGRSCVISSAGPILQKATSQKEKYSIGQIFLSFKFSSWKESTEVFGGFLILMDQMNIVATMRLEALDTIHINWNKFWGDILFAGDSRNPFKKQTLIWRNKGNKPIASRGKFTAYKFSLLNKYAPIIDNTRSRLNLGKIGGILGYLGLAFEFSDCTQKVFKGKAKFVDFGKLSFDAAITLAEPLHDWLIGSSSTLQKLSISKVTSNLGKTIAQTKYATKIVGAGSKVGIGMSTAGVGSASAIAIVGFQCIGAFLTGYSIGEWIENRTHWGEQTVNWLWEKFLGDWIKQYYEWKINKVVMIQYPATWTENEIGKFKSKIEYIH